MKSAKEKRRRLIKRQNALGGNKKLGREQAQREEARGPDRRATQRGVVR